MTEHVVEISESAARLRVELDRLLIERAEHGAVAIPLGEIAALVLTSPQTVLTQPVLAGLASHGAIVVACDTRRQPVCMLLPLDAHSTQSARMRAQASVSAEVKARVWKQIVQAKVNAQARILEEARGSDAGLSMLARRVTRGDPSNIESQASVRYWKALFAAGPFKRNRRAADANALLNYGYAILRAATARAICAAGLHPTLGLHHRNQYNAFCLADDLMEPYRPTVDAIVVRLVESEGPTELDGATRQALVAAILGRHVASGEARTLFDLLSIAASSLAMVLIGQRRLLDLRVPGT